MSGFRIKYKVLAISVCLVFAGWAAVSAEEFLPVSEVREGMHGYAKTVVHGTQVETFDVDVLGVTFGCHCVWIPAVGGTYRYGDSYFRYA